MNNKNYNEFSMDFGPQLEYWYEIEFCCSAVAILQIATRIECCYILIIALREQFQTQEQDASIEK